MENHALSVWEIILESNILNFIAFMGIIIWFGNKSLPSVIQQKNAELIDELNTARTRCKEAEFKLASTEKELTSFKENLEQMKAETERRIGALKDELKEERAEKMNYLKAKYDKEIESWRINLKSEIQAKMIANSLKIAESFLISKASDKKLEKGIFDQTLNLLENNPNILRN